MSAIEKLHNTLDDQLKFIALENHSVLKRAELSIAVCEEALSRLREIVLAKKFKNQTEEIQFFRSVKPVFSSKLIFYFLLFKLEKYNLNTDTKAQLKHYEKALESIEEFRSFNIEFYTYYRTGSDFFDQIYFSRNNTAFQLIDSEDYMLSDRSFSTTHDGLVAKILANDLLESYIKDEIEKIRVLDGLPPLDTNKPKIAWTESKVSLTLLIYALHSSRCFNAGNVELKELADTFSKVFGIELGDIYRTWAEIKLRKDPTKFLETLKMAIEDRMMIDLQ